MTHHLHGGIKPHLQNKRKRYDRGMGSSVIQDLPHRCTTGNVMVPIGSSALSSFMAPYAWDPE